LLSGYNGGRTTRAQFIHLYRRASESDRPGAEPVGDLQSRQTDATRSRWHQNRLGGGKSA
jgi:hypothetical protein